MCEQYGSFYSYHSALVISKKKLTGSDKVPFSLTNKDDNLLKEKCLEEISWLVSRGGPQGSHEISLKTYPFQSHYKHYAINPQRILY